MSAIRNAPLINRLDHATYHQAMVLGALRAGQLDFLKEMKVACGFLWTPKVSDEDRRDLNNRTRGFGGFGAVMPPEYPILNNEAFSKNASEKISRAVGLSGREDVKQFVIDFLPTVNHVALACAAASQGNLKLLKSLGLNFYNPDPSAMGGFMARDVEIDARVFAPFKWPMKVVACIDKFEDKLAVFHFLKAKLGSMEDDLRFVPLQNHIGGQDTRKQQGLDALFVASIQTGDLRVLEIIENVFEISVSSERLQYFWKACVVAVEAQTQNQVFFTKNNFDYRRDHRPWEKTVAKCLEWFESVYAGVEGTAVTSVSTPSIVAGKRLLLPHDYAQFVIKHAPRTFLKTLPVVIENEV